MNRVLAGSLPPTERLLFESDSVVIGQVRCPPDAAHFRNCGSTRTYCALFPRSAVLIRRRGRRPFTEDPTVVGLYNRGEEYERFKVSPEGDRGDWFAFSPEAICDAIRALDPAAGDDRERPLRVAWARCSPATVLRQRLLFEHVRRTPDTDPMGIEEMALALLDAVVHDAYTAAPTSEPPRRVYELAEAARQVLDLRYAQQISLQQIASLVDTSMFHLCRAFRRAHGTTIHRYLTVVRLRRALERLSTPHVDLAQLAIDLGFNTHSHFTAAFRREFGASPSAVRGRITASTRQARIR